MTELTLSNGQSLKQAIRAWQTSSHELRTSMNGLFNTLEEVSSRG